MKIIHYWEDGNDGEIQSLFDKKIIHGGIVDKDIIFYKCKS